MMIKKPKLWLILAATLVLIGLVLFTVAMAQYKWDFTQLNTVPFETNTYNIDNTISSISLETDTADIHIVPAKNNKCQVVCYEQENLKHSVAVLDGTLTIQEVDTQKWHEQIGFSVGSSKITIYLPETAYTNLTVRESTGDITIEKDFSFASMDIQATTGDVKNYASVTGVMKIRTDTGHIRMEEITASVLDLTVTTGNIAITDSHCENLTSIGNTSDISLKNVTVAGSIRIKRSTGDVTLNGTKAAEIQVDTGTGDVTFNDADAAEILVNTDTGDVTGNLLTEKVFMPVTDTGDVDVPNSKTGGKCEIHTDTGDITITVG